MLKCPKCQNTSWGIAKFEAKSEDTSDGVHTTETHKLSAIVCKACNNIAGILEYDAPVVTTLARVEHQLDGLATRVNQILIRLAEPSHV